MINYREKTEKNLRLGFRFGPRSFIVFARDATSGSYGILHFAPLLGQRLRRTYSKRPGNHFSFVGEAGNFISTQIIYALGCTLHMIVFFSSHLLLIDTTATVENRKPQVLVVLHRSLQYTFRLKSI